MSASGDEPAGRRPLASRGLGFIRGLAAWLAARRVAPNVISISSVVFSLVGAAAMLATAQVDGAGARALWFCAALCVQLRLLANVTDGLVAIEGGKASPTGDLYNEVPDRISDAVTLSALGLVPGGCPHLGYGAAILAVTVAYVRAMGVASGAGQCFAGPVSKPQRMFLVTLACLFQAFTPLAWQGPWGGTSLGAPGWILALIVAGSVATIGVRLAVIGKTLHARS